MKPRPPSPPGQGAERQGDVPLLLVCRAVTSARLCSVTCGALKTELGAVSSLRSGGTPHLEATAVTCFLAAGRENGPSSFGPRHLPPGLYLPLSSHSALQPLHTAARPLSQAPHPQGPSSLVLQSPTPSLHTFFFSEPFFSHEICPFFSLSTYLILGGASL